MEIRSFVDLVYAERAGQSLKLDIFRPADDRVYPILLHVHGGGWCHGERTGVAAFTDSVNHGYVVVDIDYRLAPDYPYPAGCDDVRAAAQWLQAHADAYGGDGARIGGLGYSAGGYFLAMLATEPDSPLSCSVCWANPTDMRREPVTHPFRGCAWAFMSACPNEHPDLYAAASPVTRLTAQTPPILHLHGTADDVVPVHHAHLLADAAARVGAPVEVILHEGGGHCGTGNEQDLALAVARIWQFYAQYLQRG
jgi:acetyl esterase/lipase